MGRGRSATYGAFGLERAKVGRHAVTAKARRLSGHSSGLLKQQTGETAPERIEAKPGDLKLVVSGGPNPFSIFPPVQAWGKLLGRAKVGGGTQ